MTCEEHRALRKKLQDICKVSTATDNPVEESHSREWKLAQKYSLRINSLVPTVGEGMMYIPNQVLSLNNIIKEYGGVLTT